MTETRWHVDCCSDLKVTLLCSHNEKQSSIKHERVRAITNKLQTPLSIRLSGQKAPRASICCPSPSEVRTLVQVLTPVPGRAARGTAAIGI